MILAIDVGVNNLGLCLLSSSSEDVVVDFELIDLTTINKSFRHKKVNFFQCTLFHTNEIWDRLQHCFQEYSEWFDGAETICIERQPITGITSVEQIIFGTYRQKAILISPNQMHRYFEIEHHDYDNRKIQTIEILKRYCTTNELKQKFKKMKDPAHCADACCIGLFYKKIIYKRIMRRNNIQNLPIDDNDSEFSLLIKSFRYKGKYVLDDYAIDPPEG